MWGTKSQDSVHDDIVAGIITVQLGNSVSFYGCISYNYTLWNCCFVALYIKKKARRRRKDQEKDKDLVHTDKKHGTYVVSISSIMLLQSGIAIVWGSGGYCL